MNEFWTTVLSSAGAAALASSVMSGIITTVASVWIQHVYDKKLEEHKAQVQKIIDEHQIRFRYWQEEKANAIKDLYKCINELYFDVGLLQSFEKEMPHCLKDQELKIKERINSKIQETTAKWLGLRLFLSTNEDLSLAEFHEKTSSWIVNLFNPDAEQRKEYIKENGKKMVGEINSIMEKLRGSFQEALNVVATDSLPNKQNLKNSHTE